MAQKKKKEEDTSTVSIPEDLTTLSDDELVSLHDTAVDAFQAIMPGEDAAPSDEQLEQLDALANGISALKEEADTRDNAAAERQSKAKSIASRILPTTDEPPSESESADEATTDTQTEAPEEQSQEQPEMVAASGQNRRSRRRPAININLQGLKQRNEEEDTAPTDGDVRGRKVGFAAQGAAGYDVGNEMSIRDMAEAVNSRLSGFNASAYMTAAKRNQRQRERFTISKIKRSFDDQAVVKDEDPRDAMKFVANEANLPKKSLVASGGWCAPSETLYDLVDISEAENLVSIPEIQVTRGGVRHTLGPDYREVFADTGFCYTEEEDIAGDYDGAGGGAKPCATVPCPDFEDVRLGYCGVCIGAGLLQQRGYPEVIEDYIAKTLNAHAHRVSASVVNSMVAASTAISFDPNQAGAAAPLLAAIDLQATHYRSANRMSDNATLEVLLPTWTKALVRADLSRRLGMAEFEVSDSRISGWFTNRNVSVQYVVDWQDISTTPATGFLAPPSSVKFLLYAAGTFVKGTTESITLENIYDSVLLGTNDYTALFTEDPYLVLKRNHDARVVDIPVCADGSTNIGVDIACNGTSA